MQYKLIIPDRFESLNEFLSANRGNKYSGAKMKKDNDDIVVFNARQQLKGLKITKPILIYYRFFEKEDNRDNDNVLSCAAKFVQDGLAKAGVIINDKRKYIHNFYFDVFIDNKNPRIEITITELTEEESKMTLVNILDSIRARGCYSGG